MTARGAICIALCLTLAACATPKDRCLRAAAADLAELDARILNAERDLARGYRIEPAQTPETTLRLCAWPKEPVLFCTETTRPARSELRVPIDPAQATRDLAALRAERSAVAIRTADEQARCH